MCKLLWKAHFEQYRERALKIFFQYRQKYCAIRLSFFLQKALLIEGYFFYTWLGTTPTMTVQIGKYFILFCTPWTNMELEGNHAQNIQDVMKCKGDTGKDNVIKKLAKTKACSYCGSHCVTGEMEVKTLRAYELQALIYRCKWDNIPNSAWSVHSYNTLGLK